MGKATRWFSSFFTSKKDNNNNREEIRANAAMCHNPATIPPNISPTEAAWLRSYYLETEKEQSKHAIAVATATAAAADAAIVAAHAAVAVVKLTSNGRGKESASVLLQNCRERYAAVRIQSVFRGYLARKALRALRSLVKLQALVKGFLVRKQAAATLRSMQALVRAQATVMSRRSEIASRKSLDNLDVRSVHSRRFSSTFEAMVDERAKIVVIDTSTRPKSSSKSRSRRSNLSISESLIKDQSNYCSTRLSPLTHVSDWGLNGDVYRFSSAHSTPKFSTKRSASEWAMTPSYMANTHSFRAKVRSHSAPRQRSSDDMIKRRVSLLEMMDARNSVSHPSVSFKNAVMRKIDGTREEFGERRNGYYNNAVSR